MKNVIAVLIILAAVSGAVLIMRSQQQVDSQDENRKTAPDKNLTAKFRLQCESCDEQSEMTGDEYTAGMRKLTTGQRLTCPKCGKASLVKIGKPMSLPPPRPEDMAKALSSRKKGDFEAPAKKKAREAAATKPAQEDTADEDSDE